jgi:hypothetical protein
MMTSAQKKDESLERRECDISKDKMITSQIQTPKKSNWGVPPQAVSEDSSLLFGLPPQIIFQLGASSQRA